MYNTVTHAARSAIEDLLAQDAEIDKLGQLASNHRPMALFALASLGADEAALRAFYAHHLKFAEHALESDRIPLPEQGWTAALGVSTLYRATRDHFAARMRVEGFAPVVRAVLDQVGLAPASVAFHAIIRLGFGLEAQHVVESASGLALLVCGYQPVSVSGIGRTAAPSARAGFEQLHRALGGIDLPQNWIHQRVAAVIALPAFHGAVPAAPRHARWVDELRAAVLQIYWGSNSLTALHMVTSTHALRVVAEHVGEDLLERFRDEIWYAACAAYVSIGAPRLPDDAELAEVMRRDLPSWGVILDAALHAQDDHDIKLAYSAHQESMLDDTPLYRAVAARRLRLLSEVEAGARI